MALSRPAADKTRSQPRGRSGQPIRETRGGGCVIRDRKRGRWGRREANNLPPIIQEDGAWPL